MKNNFLKSVVKFIEREKIFLVYQIDKVMENDFLNLFILKAKMNL